MKNSFHNPTATSPTLSIVIPFFNKKILTGKMIDSIIANKFTSWELLAIDDGSSQETLEYLKKYEVYDNIQIIHRNIEPKGAQTCRNIGLQKARGEYIVFFDSDDYITPTCLGTRVSEITKRPDLDFMVFPSATLVDEDFNANAKEFIFGYKVYNDDIKAFARRELPFIVWSNIYRTASIRRNSLEWDTNLLSLQDADFNLRAILAGLKYDYCKTKADYGYRIFYCNDSVSKKICSSDHFNSHIYASENFFKYLRLHFGHKYDTAVFQGVLNLYNNIFTDGVDINYAKQMAECLKKYHKLYGTLLKIQITITEVLEHLLPKKRARQIPMVPYLLPFIIRKKMTRKKINPIM